MCPWTDRKEELTREGGGTGRSKTAPLPQSGGEALQ